MDAERRVRKSVGHERILHGKSHRLPCYGNVVDFDKGVGAVVGACVGISVRTEGRRLIGKGGVGESVLGIPVKPHIRPETDGGVGEDKQRRITNVLRTVGLFQVNAPVIPVDVHGIASKPLRDFRFIDMPNKKSRSGKTDVIIRDFRNDSTGFIYPYINRIQQNFGVWWHDIIRVSILPSQRINICRTRNPVIAVLDEKVLGTVNLCPNDLVCRSIP